MEAANCTFDNVVKTTVLLADINDFGAVNEVYTTFFSDNYPARAAYQVGREKQTESCFVFIVFCFLSGGRPTKGSPGGDRSRGCGGEDHHGATVTLETFLGNSHTGHCTVCFSQF